MNPVDACLARQAELSAAVSLLRMPNCIRFGWAVALLESARAREGQQVQILRELDAEHRDDFSRAV